MKLPLVFLAPLLAVVSTLPGLAAQSLDNVFVVHRGSGAGSCDARRQLLDNTHFPEALALTQAALSAITNYKTSRPARDHLSAFFGIKFQSQAAGSAAVDDALLGRVTGRWKFQSIVPFFSNLCGPIFYALLSLPRYRTPYSNDNNVRAAILVLTILL
jgi:hypothetical protein